MSGNYTVWLDFFFFFDTVVNILQKYCYQRRNRSEWVYFLMTTTIYNHDYTHFEKLIPIDKNWLFNFYKIDII